MQIRRKKLEILQAIKEFLDESEESQYFFKSDLRTKGVDPATADDFLKIIIFCQKELAEIEIEDVGKRYIIKKMKKKRYLSMDEFQEFKNELINKKTDLVPVKGFFGRGKDDLDRFTYNTDTPYISVYFTCQVCDVRSEYPEHCGEPMDLIDKNEMNCYFCKITQCFPKHHGKEMKLMFIKNREKNYLEN